MRMAKLPGLVLALATSIPVAGDELWRGSTGMAACPLLLINEIGGVRVDGLPAESVPVVVGSSGLTIEASLNDGTRTLVVGRDGDATSGDVELSVPPGCDVGIRTTDGSVDAEIGPAAFPLTVDTVTGDVTAWVDATAEATISLATSGEITTDYTIEIDFRYHVEPAKHGRIAIGGEATRAPVGLRLTSRRGAVSVLRPTDMSHRAR